jgi:hypothetical protein
MKKEKSYFGLSGSSPKISDVSIKLMVLGSGTKKESDKSFTISLKS